MQRYTFNEISETYRNNYLLHKNRKLYCYDGDVAKIEAENEQLRKENKALKEIKDKLKELFYRSGDEDYVKLMEEYGMWIKQKLEK